MGGKNCGDIPRECAFNKNKNKSQLQDASIIARSKLVLAGGLSPYLEEKEIAVPKELEKTCFIKMNEQQIFAFETPSLALNMGHNLVKTAEIKRGNAIRMSDDVMKKESDDFLMLHFSDWTQMIHVVALATLRSNKPMALPVTSDLVY
ncbi:Hypothetical predicted protein [Mytilus galloprovincialis]|uniref:Uncharacterized protein n=1 Tax=Mytilus galloprovincialis TaxID=29158 RepID=A0A8B6DE73_MYTGA|nr:Hypothetical predicted protein [Mytilus galloprovincialis]